MLADGVLAGTTLDVCMLDERKLAPRIMLGAGFMAAKGLITSGGFGKSSEGTIEIIFTILYI